MAEVCEVTAHEVPMSMRAALLILGAALLVGAAVWLYWPRETTGERVLRILREADRFELYSLEPIVVPADPQTPFLGNFPVLGRTLIDDATTRDRLIASMADNLHTDYYPECYWPRHAIVVATPSGPAVIEICFQCRTGHLRIAGETAKFSIQGSPKEVFNDILIAR